MTVACIQCRYFYLTVHTGLVSPLTIGKVFYANQIYCSSLDLKSRFFVETVGKDFNVWLLSFGFDIVYLSDLLVF